MSVSQSESRMQSLACVTSASAAWGFAILQGDGADEVARTAEVLRKKIAIALQAECPAFAIRLAVRAGWMTGPDEALIDHVFMEAIACS